MKLFTATSLSILLFPSVQGCLKVHTWLQTSPYDTDVMSIQIWDNGKQVCYGQSGKFLSDNKDHFKVTCGKYWADMWDNGREGKVGNSGYTASLHKKKQKVSNWCCLWGASDTCLSNCSGWEMCLTDEFGNCNGSCKLCDGRAKCGKVP